MKVETALMQLWAAFRIEKPNRAYEQTSGCQLRGRLVAFVFLIIASCNSIYSPLENNWQGAVKIARLYELAEI